MIKLFIFTVALLISGNSYAATQRVSWDKAYDILKVRCRIDNLTLLPILDQVGYCRSRNLDCPEVYKRYDEQKLNEIEPESGYGVIYFGNEIQVISEDAIIE